MNKNVLSLMGEVDNVKVVVRCRPLTNDEIQQSFNNIVQVNRIEKTISVTNPFTKNEPVKIYTFDEVFDHTCDQIIIYNTIARSIIENVLRGYNGTIFAYGQTGTGKTYTMSGNEDIPEKRGIIPNSFAHIFDHISKCENAKTFLVRVSYLEIYNEEVRDLLVRTSQQQNAFGLEVKERSDIGVYVKDLSNITVSSADHMFKLMQFGNSNRHVGATKMNERSSRSHALFTVTIECSETIGGRQHLTQGKLHLVDLAGSERQSKTNAVGDRLKEASKINLSLSNLGNVISALVDLKSTHIPYRNSKLTRLLQDSLGGNSKTVMIANIGPASYNYDETISTLRYANRAKSIKNVSRINEDPKDALLRKFQQEIENLRKQLENDEYDNGNENDNDNDNFDNELLNLNQQQQRRFEVIDQNFSNRISEMENEIFVKRERLKIENGMLEAERKQLANELMHRETELEASKREHDNLMKKLATIERKLIIGGENMLKKAEKQAQLLEQSNLELEHARQTEQEMHKRLASGEVERLDIEEKYNSLQEEAVGITRKLKKVWNQYNLAKIELKDTEEEHQREIEALLENIRQLNKELALATKITELFIPKNYMHLIEQSVYWNEEIGDWKLKGIAYTGNNMRKNTTGKQNNLALNNKV